MVEFALVLPILLLVLFAIFDFGRALNYWNDANQMAADGARFAAVNRNPGGSTMTFQNWVRAQASSELYTGSDSVTAPAKVCVAFRDTNGDSQIRVGDAVEVKVLSDFHLLPRMFPTPVNGHVLTLNGSATMRLEQAPTNISTSNNPTGCA